jgi:hypothetical protein
MKRRAEADTGCGRRHVTDQIRFDDGAAYERNMGRWSQLAGETFLDWLAPGSGWRCAGWASSFQCRQALMRARLPADVAGRITYGALANAVRGRVAVQ